MNLRMVVCYFAIVGLVASAIAYGQTGSTLYLVLGGIDTAILSWYVSK